MENFCFETVALYYDEALSHYDSRSYSMDRDPRLTLPEDGTPVLDCTFRFTSTNIGSDESYHHKTMSFPVVYDP